MSNGTNTNTKEKNEDKGFFGNLWEDVKEGAEDIVEGAQDVIEDYTGPLTDNQEEEEEAQEERDIKEITDEESDVSQDAEDYLTSLSNKDQVYQFEEEEGIQLFEGIEETVVPDLRDKFSNLLSGPNKKGFEFEETGFGTDNVKITAPNGEVLTLPLDNLRRGTNLEQVQKFNAFMLEHSKDFSQEDLVTTHDPDDDVQRVVDIQNGGDITDEQKRQHEADAIGDMEGGWKQMVGDFLSNTGGSLVEWEKKEIEKNPNAKYQGGSGMATGLGNMLSGMGNWETFNPMQKSFEKANSYFNDPVSKGGLGGKIPKTNANGDVIYDGDGNPVTRDVTDQDLRDFALQDRVDYYKENDIKEQVNNFLDEYAEKEGGYEAKDYLESQAARILKENQSVVNKVGVLQESFTNDYNNYYKEAEKVKAKLAKGETLTSAEVKAFNNLQSGVFKKIELMKELKDPYQKALEQSRTYDKAEDVLDNIADPTLSKVYNGLTTIEGLVGQGAWLAGNVAEFATDKAFGAMDEHLGTNISQYSDVVSDVALGPLGLLIGTDGMKEMGRTLMDDADERKTHLRDLPEGYHSLGNFVEKAINGTIENLPQLGLAYVTGGGSIGANMAVFGVSGAASKHFEMTKENEEWHAEHGENMYNTMQMIKAPIAYGGFESVTMVPEVLMMRGAFKGGGKSPFGKSLAGKVFNTTFGYVKAAGTELPQEIGTQIGQNYVDKHMLGKDVELSDGINDDFLIKVVGSAGVFQTYGNVAQGAGKMINGVTSKMHALDMSKNMQPMNVTNQIAQGSKDIQATQMEIAKLKTQKENGGGDVDVIDSKIKNLETKRERQVKDQQKRVNRALDYSKVGTKGVNKLRGFARQQNQIQKQVAAIKNNPKLKPIEKAEQIETLRKEFDNLESKKGQIINNENKYQLENQEQVNQLESQARDNLMEQNNGKIPNEQQVAKEAEKIYDEQNYVTEKNANEAKTIMENQVAKLESEALINKVNQIDPSKPIAKKEFNTLVEAKLFLLKDMESKGYADTSEQTLQAIKELEANWNDSAATIVQPEVLQDGNKVLNPETHTFDKHQTIIVNKKKADTDTNFAARGHDLFHGMLWKAFKSSGQGFKNLAEGLVKHINSKDKAGAQWLNDELTQLSPSDINYHEEVIAKIADGMRNKQIKITPDISKRINSLIRQTGQQLGIDTELMINDPADMFELIDSYNKNLKGDGRLSGALKSALEQGVVVDPKLQPKRQTKPDARITKQYKQEKSFENKIQKLYDTYLKGIGKLVIPSPLTQQDLKQGETIVETEKDSKGRIVTKISSTQEKDGIRTTKFSFNRNDKPTTQRNRSEVDTQTAFGNDLEVDRENSGVDPNIEITKVKEIREDTKTGDKVATVEGMNEFGDNMELDVILKPKAKSTTLASQKLESERALKEIVESYRTRVTKILDAEWTNFLEANNIRKHDNSGQISPEYKDIVDNILTGERGVLDQVLDYNINMKVPLSGYIGSIMSKRGISEQVFEVVPDTSGMYKQAIDAETKQIADEVIEEIVEAKKDLLKETINLDPSILNKVVQAVTKTFGTKLGDITSPQFKKNLAKSFRTELHKVIKDTLGKRADYKDYLENNWENIWKALPQDIVNARFKKLIEPVLDSKGKQVREKTKAGRRIFKKKKLTQQEFMDYFLGDKVGDSTKGTRKDALAQGIAETLARDEVMDVLSNPEVAAKFEDINALLDLKLPKNWKSYVQKAIDGIDRSIAEINDPNNLFVGPPKSVMTGFLKAVKAGLKAGKNFLEAVNAGLDKHILPWLKSATSLERALEVFNSLKNHLSFWNEPKNEAEAKEQLAEIKNLLENTDIKATSVRFVKATKKLTLEQAKEKGISEYTYNELQDTVNDKEVGHTINGDKHKAGADVTGKFADDMFHVLNNLPPTIHKILDNIYTGASRYGIFGLHDRGVNVTDSDRAKNAPNYHRDKFFKGENLPKNAKYAKPKFKTDSTYKYPKEIQKDIKQLEEYNKNGKIQPMNIGKSFLDRSPMLSKMIDIVGVRGAVEAKIKKIMEIFDPEVAQANKLLGKTIAKILKHHYKNGDIDLKSLYMLLKEQSNTVSGWRSLGGIMGLPVMQEAIKINKGEHVDPNTGAMTDLLQYMMSDTMTDQDLVNILDKDQLFANQEKYLDPVDDKLGPTVAGLGIFRMTKGLGKKIANQFVMLNEGGQRLYDVAEKRAKQEAKRKLKRESAKKKNATWTDFSRDEMRNMDKAKTMVEEWQQGNLPDKGITIMDFDETLANTKEKVLYTMPDGKKGKLTTKQFADKAAELTDAGAIFDYSQFEKVKGAKRGPMFEKAMDLATKYGTDQIHILTARPQSAMPAIQAFMKANGLEIKAENITGVEDGNPQAKRAFVLEKAAEGFNDFFFADDSKQNVEIIKETLKGIDIKNEAVLAKQNFKKDLNKEFSNIVAEGLVDSKGKPMTRNATINMAKAKSKGARRGGWFTNFWIPPSAEDFNGLLYSLLSSGPRGDKQKAFFKKALIDPFAKGIKDLNAFKQVLAKEFGALKKDYPEVTKILRKDSGISSYTNSHAIRVYNWLKSGYALEDMDISQADANNLTNHVESNPDMKNFADELREVTKIPEGYPPPKESWVVGNIDTDIMDIGFIKRPEFLQEFLNNKDKVFDKENLKKLEYKYGTNYVDALNDMIYRMKHGINKPMGSDKLVNKWQSWVNNSVGAIMFFNMRSAVLQTLSSVNFINWNDNNPIKAAKALANQPQFWKDFSFIFNHPTLKQRRAGMDIDVNAAEIAQRVANSNDPVSSALNWLLQKGFIPTRMADSFAIAIGGASMYRNRVNTYLDKGFTKAEAESKAWLDFQEISEATQQSARPDMISKQQAGPLGRLVLAFQVTPMQYARLMKRAAQDLVNKRGDMKTNISKIIYYGAVQNFIFNAMQKAAFALLFASDDEDDEDKMSQKQKKKAVSIMNGMADTILRGLGVGGAVVATVKNMVIEFLEQEKKGYRADHAYTLVEGLNISPPIGSKSRKIYNATQTWKFNRDIIKEMGPDIDNPIYEGVADLVSGGTNVPVDRVLQNINNVRHALDKQNAAWQRIATLMGWPSWYVDIPKREIDEAKRELKEKKAREKKFKAKIKKLNKAKK